MRQNRLIESQNVVISTTIPRDIYHAAKEQHIAFNSLLFMGWQHFKGQPAIISRQRELEEENQKLQRAVSRLQGLLLELSQKVKE